MRIAAELRGSKIKVFIEGSSWAMTTQPLNNEIVLPKLVVYCKDDETIFHDAVSKPNPETHPSLMFCREEHTLTTLKKKLVSVGYGEPYEVSLGNDKFDLKKVFPRAYAHTFHNYSDNAACLGWLRSLSYHQADLLIKGLLTQGRYFNAAFSQFREFSAIEAFIDHRFEIWHQETVKEFEEALLKDKTHCPSCDI